MRRGALLFTTVALLLAMPAGVALAATLFGTAGSDNLDGTSADDVLLGRGGGDIMLGKLGEDTLSGGEGRDSISGDRGKMSTTAAPVAISSTRTLPLERQAGGAAQLCRGRDRAPRHRRGSSAHNVPRRRVRGTGPDTRGHR